MGWCKYKIKKKIPSVSKNKIQNNSHIVNFVFTPTRKMYIFYNMTLQLFENVLFYKYILYKSLQLSEIPGLKKKKKHAPFNNQHP